MSPIHIVDALIAVYVALIAAIHLRSRRLRAAVAASGSWAAAASTVLEAKLDAISSIKGGTTYRPVVTYEYAVDGTRHRGARLYFGDVVGYSFERTAQRELAALATGARTQVFYDPADPTQAVIERRAPILRRDAFLSGILLVVLVGMVVGRLYFAA